MDPGPQEKEGLLFAKMYHFFFGVYLLSIVNMNESGSTPAGLTSTTMVGRELPSFELLYGISPGGRLFAPTGLLLGIVLPRCLQTRPTIRTILTKAE